MSALSFSSFDRLNHYWNIFLLTIQFFVFVCGVFCTLSCDLVWKDWKDWKDWND